MWITASLLEILANFHRIEYLPQSLWAASLKYHKYFTFLNRVLDGHKTGGEISAIIPPMGGLNVIISVYCKHKIVWLQNKWQGRKRVHVLLKQQQHSSCTGICVIDTRNVFIGTTSLIWTYFIIPLIFLMALVALIPFITLNKSNNTTVEKYSIRSRSPAFQKLSK